MVRCEMIKVRLKGHTMPYGTHIMITPYMVTPSHLLPLQNGLLQFPHFVTSI